ncbi:MAG: DUF72 domain-containing protein [Planctomycetes bacterium]|nr:DUF72 domain-containing protein [Planctomycetota bacterium]
MHRILHGTSSWSEKSWVGPFYPDKTPPGEFLAYYATHFPAVEADVTYYRIPGERMVEGWARKTPPGFELCAKFPRSIVHGGEAARPDPECVLVPERVGADVERFTSVMKLLGEKCGPLVLQFPYFNKTVFGGPGEFLERLDPFLAALPAGHRYAVEVRNGAWVRPPLLKILRKHRVALVLVELAYLPHPAKLAKQQELITTDFAYARLIGDRKAVDAKTKTFDRLVLDKSEDLDLWATLLREIREKVPKTYAFANNHYAGHGPATIRDLLALVEG